MATTHPDWLAIGNRVQIVCTLGRSDQGRINVTVVRHTKTSVVVLYPGSTATDRFVAKDGAYHLVPRYLDYTNKLAPLEPQGDPLT